MCAAPEEGPEMQNHKAHSLTAPFLSSAGHTKSLSFTESMSPFPPCPRGVARRSSESLWTLEQPQDLAGTASGRELLFTLQPHQILVQPTSIFIVHPLPHTLYNLQPDSLYSHTHTHTNLYNPCPVLVYNPRPESLYSLHTLSLYNTMSFTMSFTQFHSKAPTKIHCTPTPIV